MIKSNSDLIRGLNNFIKTSTQFKISSSGVTLYTNEKDGKYFNCRIGQRHYWLLLGSFGEAHNKKGFIHLFDDQKDKPSVVQFTIDKSNFSIKNKTFYVVQNRGTTIQKRIPGFEQEFKVLMHKNGFNIDNIVISGNSISPNYLGILKQIFDWLKIRVQTKLQLEEKYRIIENALNENEPDIESRTEGGKKIIISTRAERDGKLRRDAIHYHGLKCQVCFFDFEKEYGPWGKDYIEVHHIMRLGGSNKPRVTNPKTDLNVVCSNCHRMIHRKRDTTLTVDELKSKLSH